MKHKKLFHTQKQYFLIITIVLFLAVAIIFIYYTFLKKTVSSSGIQDGLAYLQSLENTDISIAEAKIKERDKSERRAALEKGELSLWQQFYDYAIVGDSRAMGFSAYQFLESDRVLADLGATISDVESQYLNQLLVLNPSTIYLCFGINDMGMTAGLDEYLEEIDRIMELLNQQLPNAAVYLNSILPVVNPTEAIWNNIPEWNDAIKTHCEEKGYHYIDNSQIIADHSDLYDVDGVHFLPDFYQYWAINMLTEVNE